MSAERWTHPLALEVSRIVHAFPRGDTRREDVLDLADRIEAELAANQRLGKESKQWTK